MGLGRVELPTSRLSGVRSHQLSYRPLEVSRGGEGEAYQLHTSLSRAKHGQEAQGMVLTAVESAAQSPPYSR